MVAHRVTYLAAEVGGYHAKPVTAGTPYVPELMSILLHNWLDAISIENAYSTDVTGALTITEERVALNQRPQRTVSARLDAIRKDDCSRVLALLTRLGQQPIPFPLYCDWTKVTATSSNGADSVVFGTTSIVPCDTTTRRFFVGSQVVVFDLDSDHRPANIELQTVVSVADAALTITRLTGAREARSRVIPLVLGQVTLDTAGDIATDESISARISVVEAIGATQLPTWLGYGDSPDVSTYRQIPILEYKHNWTNTPTINVRRAGSIQQEGRAPFIDTLGLRSRLTFSFSAASLQRESAAELLKFIDSRNGRLRPFWFLNLLTLFTVQDLTTAYLEVKKTFSIDDIWRSMEHVGFRYFDGSTLVRQIWRVEDTGTTLKLHFTESMPSLKLALSSLRYVTSAHLVRLANDAYLERWDTDGSVSVEFDAVELHAARDVPRVLFSDSMGFGPELIKDLFGYWTPDPTRMFKPDTSPVTTVDDQVDRWLDSVYNRALHTPLAPYHTWYPTQFSLRAANSGTSFELEENLPPHSNALGLTVFAVIKRPAGHTLGASDYLLRYPDSGDTARDAAEWTLLQLHLNEGVHHAEQESSLSYPDLAYPRGTPHILAFVWVPGKPVRVYRDGLLLGFMPLSPFDLPAALPYALRVFRWGNAFGDPTSADDAQMYRLLIYSRALDKRELNGAGDALRQAVAGTTWTRVV